MLIRIMGTILCMVGAVTSRVAFGKVASSDYVDKIVAGLDSNSIVRTDKNYNGDLSGTYNLQPGANLTVKKGAKITMESGTSLDVQNLSSQYLSVYNGNVWLEDANVSVTGVGSSVEIVGGNFTVSRGNGGEGHVYLDGDIDVNGGQINVNTVYGRNGAINVNSGANIQLSGADIDIYSITDGVTGAGIYLHNGPTITLDGASEMIMNSGSKMHMYNGSAIKMNSGSVMNVTSGASVNFSGYSNKNSNLNMNKGSSINMANGANINMNNGSSLEFKNGAAIGGDILFDFNSSTDFQSGATINFHVTHVNGEAYYEGRNTYWSGSNTTFASGATVTVASGATFTVPTPPLPAAD